MRCDADEKQDGDVAMVQCGKRRFVRFLVHTPLLLSVSFQTEEINNKCRGEISDLKGERERRLRKDSETFCCKQSVHYGSCSSIDEQSAGKSAE